GTQETGKGRVLRTDAGAGDGTAGADECALAGQAPGQDGDQAGKDALHGPVRGGEGPSGGRGQARIFARRSILKARTYRTKQRGEGRYTFSPLLSYAGQSRRSAFQSKMSP